MKLGSYACNHWQTGTGTGQLLSNAVDGSGIATIDSVGIDVGAMHAWARDVGGPNLRRMTFHERALLLKSLAQYLSEHKEEFYELSTATGATRADSWIDIDGGISTLYVYASKGRRELPNSGRSRSPATARSSGSTCSCRSTASRCISMHSISRAGACWKSLRPPCSRACRRS
jgi:acyl-CoA reductase-like NAD-dependent aldehyde dehydrogenase